MMIELKPELFFEIKGRIKEILEYLDNNEAVNYLIERADNIAVKRLHFNAHGKWHARFVAAISILLLRELEKIGIKPNTVLEGYGSFEDAEVVVGVAGYLHDIGISINRENHEILGVLVAKELVQELLDRYYDNLKLKLYIENEIYHCIYSHTRNRVATSIEASVVKLADGLDILYGRAKHPMKEGKFDIHAFSADAIKKVSIDTRDRNLEIHVYMKNSAGFFQLESMTIPKIQSGKLRDIVKIYVYVDKDRYLIYPVKKKL